MATFPTKVIYLPTTLGGLGLPRLSNYILGDCSVGSSSLAVATTVGLATSLAWRPAQVLDFFSPVCLAHLFFGKIVI